MMKELNTKADDDLVGPARTEDWQPEFSRVVDLKQVRKFLRMSIEPTEEERKNLSERLNAKFINRLNATILIRPKKHPRDVRYIVSGKISAEVVLNCVITGEDYILNVGKHFSSVIKIVEEKDDEDGHRDDDDDDEFELDGSEIDVEDNENWYDDVSDDWTCDVGEIVSQYLMLEMPIPSISEAGRLKAKESGFLEELDEDQARDIALEQATDIDRFRHK